MLKFKKISRSKQNMLIAVAVLLIIIVGYLLYSSFIANSPDKIRPSGVEQIDLSQQLPPIKTEFSTDFLNLQPYTELKKTGNYPVESGQVGRDNPFDAAN